MEGAKEAAMSTQIDRREDVSPKEGMREYGDVKFGDETNKKYPIDTPEHIRAAWSYIKVKCQVGIRGLTLA
jgi:hypothetical protein